MFCIKDPKQPRKREDKQAETHRIDEPDQERCAQSAFDGGQAAVPVDIHGRLLPGCVLHPLFLRVHLLAGVKHRKQDGPLGSKAAHVGNDHGLFLVFCVFFVQFVLHFLCSV